MINIFSEAELRELDRRGASRALRRDILARRQGRRPKRFEADWREQFGEQPDQLQAFHAGDPDWRLKGGGTQSFVEPLQMTVADGTQVSNSTAETILVPDFNIPDFYMVAGRTIRMTAYGVNSNVVTTPGTITFRVRWGGVAGTLLLASAAFVMDTTARTNAFWYLTCTITCRSDGSTGTVMSGGFCFITNQRGAVGLANNTEFNTLVMGLGSAGAPIASANAAVTVDTTTNKLLSLTVQESVNTNPTNVTCQSRTLEALN